MSEQESTPVRHLKQTSGNTFACGFGGGATGPQLREAVLHGTRDVSKVTCAACLCARDGAMESLRSDNAALRQRVAELEAGSVHEDVAVTAAMREQARRMREIVAQAAETSEPNGLLDAADIRALPLPGEQPGLKIEPLDIDPKQHAELMELLEFSRQLATPAGFRKLFGFEPPHADDDEPPKRTDSLFVLDEGKGVDPEVWAATKKLWDETPAAGPDDCETCGNDRVVFPRGILGEPAPCPDCGVKP